MSRFSLSLLLSVTLFFLATDLRAQENPQTELIYPLRPGETISFYTRVAPDLSAIGFTKTRVSIFNYAPTILDPNSKKETPLKEIQYDPTFSPDYDLQTGTGFVFGARGGTSNFAKYMAFYLPGQFSLPKREFFFSNINGYATVALLDDPTILPPRLRPFVGKYVVMGKSWRWFIVEATNGPSGRALDYRRVFPKTGDKAAEPLCPGIVSNFDKADSMLSPRGQYLSAKRMDRDKVPVLVRTKDCTILPTPTLDGLYGGKASFSNDERFMVFHAFGLDGRQHVVDQITNNGLIKKWADAGLVSNLFMYDIETGKLHQLTHFDQSTSSINFFPNFSGDGTWIYFHQHKKDADASEIYRIKNPVLEPELSASLIEYKTAFFIAQPSEKLSWGSLAFEPAHLKQLVRALKGEMYPARPPEWDDYFDSNEFEDENTECLSDAHSWRLVSGRIVPLATGADRPKPELSLAFQPFCNARTPSIASDTSIQVVLTNTESQWSAELFDFVRSFARIKTPHAKIEDAGFTHLWRMKQFSDMPNVIDNKNTDLLVKRIDVLKNSGFQLTAAKWMASLPGQLDWVFGKLSPNPRDGELEPVPLTLTNRQNEAIADLGLFDFLPFVLREPFQNLSKPKRNDLLAFHVSEDLHSSRKAAKRVLEIDLRVTDPERTNHDQASCIQCHSAQERIERATEFLKHGGAKEFGYFFRGLGWIEDKAYVNWRSIQESRVLDQLIQNRMGD